MTEYDGSILRVSPPLTGWTELGRTTLSSAGDDITVSSFTAKPYLMVLVHDISSGSATGQTRFNSDTANNYAHRRNNDGGADSTTTSTSSIRSDYGASSSTTSFSVMNINNIATEEKLVQGHSVAQNTAGAANAPHRSEYVGKWANTSNQITTVTQNNLSAGDFDTNSEVVVLGWDSADTNNTPFWEELASVELTSSASSISSDITAKKYLWVQAYLYNTGTMDTGLRFNSDSGNNYAERRSDAGASDATSTSSDHINFDRNNTPNFVNLFIINKSDKEKLVIAEHAAQNTAGAGTAPQRRESVAKWTNTSSQITNIEFSKQGSGADLDSGTTLRIWGAD